MSTLAPDSGYLVDNRGEEIMAVVKALWDSWAEDAIIDDSDNGRYALPERIRDDVPSLA
jgi:hypothetical protein